MFKVLWGTNEEGGWSKPQSVKWALVYDLRHEGWKETFMEKPRYVPQYDDISDDEEEDRGGRPGIPVYKPENPGQEFIAPTETAEQTETRRRSERLSHVAPHMYREGRSNERRRSTSVPTRPKHVWRLACIQLGKQARKLQLLGRTSEATEQCPSQVTFRLYRKTLSLILLPIRDIIKMNKSAVSTILCLFI